MSMNIHPILLCILLQEILFVLRQIKSPDTIIKRRQTQNPLLTKLIKHILIGKFQIVSLWSIYKLLYHIVSTHQFQIHDQETGVYIFIGMTTYSFQVSELKIHRGFKYGSQIMISQINRPIKFYQIITYYYITVDIHHFIIFRKQVRQ